eukprot:scpid61927/ scgid9833/ 
MLTKVFLVLAFVAVASSAPSPPPAQQTHHRPHGDSDREVRRNGSHHVIDPVDQHRGDVGEPGPVDLGNGPADHHQGRTDAGDEASIAGLVENESEKEIQYGADSEEPNVGAGEASFRYDEEGDEERTLETVEDESEEPWEINDNGEEGEWNESQGKAGRHRLCRGRRGRCICRVLRIIHRQERPGPLEENDAVEDYSDQFSEVRDENEDDWEMDAEPEPHRPGDDEEQDGERRRICRRVGNRRGYRICRIIRIIRKHCRNSKNKSPCCGRRGDRSDGPKRRPHRPDVPGRRPERPGSPYRRPQRPDDGPDHRPRKHPEHPGGPNHRPQRPDREPDRRPQRPDDGPDHRPDHPDRFP